MEGASALAVLPVASSAAASLGFLRSGACKRFWPVVSAFFWNVVQDVNVLFDTPRIPVSSPANGMIGNQPLPLPSQITCRRRSGLLGRRSMSFARSPCLRPASSGGAWRDRREGFRASFLLSPAVWE